MSAGRTWALAYLLLCAADCSTEPSSAPVDAGPQDERREDAIVTDLEDDTTGDLRSEEAETPVDAPDERFDVAFDLRTDIASTKDGSGDADASPPPPCIQRGGLYFSRPNVVLSISQVYGSHQFAANRDQRVAIVFGEPGLASYIDSLDGGRTFRPLFHIPQLTNTNMNVAVGPHYVHITSAQVSDPQAVRHLTAAIDTLQDPSQFVVTQFDGPNAGLLVPSPQDWIAVLLRAGVFSTTWYVSIAQTPPMADFSEPQMISNDNFCGGLWHSSNLLYLTDAHDVSGPGLPRLDLRWSSDLGTTFSPPTMIVSTNGQVGCPALYEQTDGNILLVYSEGLRVAPEPQIVARTFDRAAQEISRTAIVGKEMGLSCLSVARASNRTYVLKGVGNAAPPRVELTYSDDDGKTWAPFIEVPYLNGSCPMMAASRDEAYLHWRTDDSMLLARVGDFTVCDMSAP
jgi:hypothetical protein